MAYNSNYPGSQYSDLTTNPMRNFDMHSNRADNRRSRPVGSPGEMPYARWDGNGIDPFQNDSGQVEPDNIDVTWSDIPLWRACLSRRTEFRDLRTVSYSRDPFEGDEETDGNVVTGLASLPGGGEATITGDCTLRFDFGLNFTGSFAVEMDLPADTRVSTATGEAAEPLRIYTLERKIGNTCGPRIEARGFTALRFAWLRFEHVTRPIRIRQVTGRMRHCPLSYAGSFSCSDPMLERIWNLCAYSARLCVDPDFEKDGLQGTWIGNPAKQRIEEKHAGVATTFRTVFPALAFDRVDRIPWAGDSRFIQLAVLHAFGAYGVCRDAFDYFWPASSECWDDFSYACVPYTLDWGLAVLKYAEYSADRIELVRRLPRLKQIAGVGRHAVPGGWLFFDWDSRITIDSGTQGSKVVEPEAQAAYVMKYIEFANEAARIYALFGDMASVAWFREAAAERQAGWLAANPNWPGQFDIHALTNAVLAGVGGAAERAMVYDRVYADPSYRCTGTPYFGHSVLRALALLGRHDDALDMLRRYWGGMVALGATTVWEEYELSWNLRPLAMPPQPFGWGGLSLCQPAGAGPVEWLHTEILGVKPLAPGFSRVAVNPHLGGLEWAEGTVPTPAGPLRVRWEKKRGRTVVDCRPPQGMEVQIL